jgi:hypothetical protein
MVNTNFKDFDEYDMGQDTDFGNQKKEKPGNDPFSNDDFFGGNQGSKRSNKSSKSKKKLDYEDPFAEDSKGNRFEEEDPFAVNNNFKKKNKPDEFEGGKKEKEDFFISNTVKQKQMGRIKEVQSDVFNSEQFMSEGDNPSRTENHKPVPKKRGITSLGIVDEELKSMGSSDRENKFQIQKPKKTPRTFGEVVDLDSTQDRTR